MKKAVATTRTTENDDDTDHDSDCGMNAATTKTMTTTTHEVVDAIVMRGNALMATRTTMTANSDEDDDGEQRRTMDFWSAKYCSHSMLYMIFL